MKRIGRLHILTDIVLQTRFSHIELAEQAIAGGADTIQFRQKAETTRTMIDIVQEIKSLCATSSVTCIVNDRVDIALAAKPGSAFLKTYSLSGNMLIGENKVLIMIEILHYVQNDISPVSP